VGRHLANAKARQDAQRTAHPSPSSHH
jgi:hypothetical protein